MFGQIHFAIWTTAFCNVDKYVLHLTATQIGEKVMIPMAEFKISVNGLMIPTLSNLLQKLNFVWTNNFYNSEKHILQLTDRRKVNGRSLNPSDCDCDCDSENVEPAAEVEEIEEVRFCLDK